MLRNSLKYPLVISLATALTVAIFIVTTKYNILFPEKIRKACEQFLPSVAPPTTLPNEVFRDFLYHHCDVVKVGAAGGQDLSTTRIDTLWWACRDMYENMKRSKDCLVYGLGSGPDVSSDTQLAGIGCEVHSFDIVITPQTLFPNANDIFTEVSEIPNVRSWKHKTMNWHYHLIGIGGSDDLKKHLLSLPTIMSSLKHQSRIIHYFKMDIELGEYPVMKDIAHMAGRIKTFVGEWHPHWLEEKGIHRQAYNYVRQMEEQGFRLFRRDFRYDFLDRNSQAQRNFLFQYLTDSSLIEHDIYYALALMGEIYFVNINFVDNAGKQ